jgi:radical SAM protein with 4Fe4S-binding SPASM domain
VRIVSCGGALALEHNGDLYSCGHYVEPGYLLGNILQTSMAELVASEKQRAFGQDKLNSLPKYCRECEVRFVWHDGCPAQPVDHDPGWRARAQLPAPFSPSLSILIGESTEIRAPAGARGLYTVSDGLISCGPQP